MGRFNNEVVIVTGGAQGIGRSAALKFALEGAQVALVDLNQEKGKQTVAEITKGGGRAQFFCADVSKSADVKSTVEKIILSMKRIDVLYNNASVFLPGKDGAVVDIDEEIWDGIISVNLKSIYLWCKYSIPHMSRAGKGVIINTSSSCGLVGIPGCDAYSASKGATAALTKSLAVEYGPKGIRVNCIAPAAIQTPMLASSDLGNTSFDEERFLQLRSPLRRYGTPEEIGNIAVFLASEEASYINGAVIVADGGITISGDLSKIPKDYDR
jgi:NAD(P)-dependent dehydrogenase (short-subunit alcohol dehydrogenase family)